MCYLKRFFTDEKGEEGSEIIEFVIILGVVISFAVIIAQIGSKATGFLNRTSSELDGVIGGTGGVTGP